MYVRHQSNTNLKYHSDPYWNGLRVNTSNGPLIDNYLGSIHRVISNAANDYRRVCAIRFDLRLPEWYMRDDSEVITRFNESLKAIISADQYRKQLASIRTHRCKIRYVWIKERLYSVNPHYHLCILLNRDAYFTLGSYMSARCADWRDCPADRNQEAINNMAERITRAWASALGCHVADAIGLVHFPRNAVYNICFNRYGHDQEFADLFYRLSYFAKADTKHYGDNKHAFGCSRG